MSKFKELPKSRMTFIDERDEYFLAFKYVKKKSVNTSNTTPSYLLCSFLANSFLVYFLRMLLKGSILTKQCNIQFL